MEAETTLFNALSNDSNITGIVGNKIYSDIRDQGDDVPAIYFERAGTEFIHTIDSHTPQAEKANFILTSFCTSRESAEALTSYVIAATANNQFLCTDKQNSYDEETKSYTTTIQLNYLIA